MSSNVYVPAYEGLLYTMLQQLRQRVGVSSSTTGSSGQGLVVAFTSVLSGEGVTHTIQGLLSGLAQQVTARALLLNSSSLQGPELSPLTLDGLCRPILGTDNIYELLTGPKQIGRGPWGGSWESRGAMIEHLRTTFDYVLIDCPALRDSNDILTIAPLVDGVLLVVEADRTRKEQILNAERSIEFARGRLLGYVLNKRSNVIPEWIYRRL